MQGVVYDCPGSDPVTGLPDGPGCAAIFDTSTCKLTAYNVGQTSMVMMELESLASLADAIGRPEGTKLRARASFLKKQTQQLWDNEYGVFASRFASGRCVCFATFVFLFVFWLPFSQRRMLYPCVSAVAQTTSRSATTTRASTDGSHRRVSGRCWRGPRQRSKRR